MLLSLPHLLRSATLLTPCCLMTGTALTGLLFGSALCAVAADTGAGVRPRRILAFGDSLVAGFAVSRKAGFTVQLEKALAAAGYPVEVINAGIPGDTSAGGRSRLAQALTVQPDLVILELGANDNLLGLSPTDLEANLEAMLGLLKGRDIPVLLAGIEPLRDLGSEYRSQFTAVYARLATKHQLPLYPDFLAGVAGRPHLNKADGIHPNPKGIKEIVRRMLPLVIESLQRTAS